MVTLVSRIIRLLFVLLLAGGVLLLRAASPAGAQVAGNTYTSPNYGFTITWDDTWFVVSEEQAPYETLVISNGGSMAIFMAVDDTSPTPEAALGALAGGLGMAAGFENMVPLRDSSGALVRGSDEQKAFAAFSFTVRQSDGSTTDMASYMEVRAIVLGQSYLVLMTMTQLNSFWFQLPAFQALSAGVVIPTAEEAPQPVAGEPGPVFVDGPWRLALASATQGRDLPGLGLAEKSGKEWVVVVLDVTNWSTRSAELNPREIRLQATGATKPLRIAPGSTRALTNRIGTVELTEDLTFTLESEDSARIVLVYSTAPGSKNHELLVNENSVPVADRFVVNLAETDIPPIAVPAETVVAVIASASDGKTLRIQVEGVTKAQRIQLLGVEPPTEGECFANEAERTLDELAGTTVLVEEDAAISGGRTPQRYVWLVNVDGTRTLLNQVLIAEGKVAAAEVPGDARFGLWLELTGIAARDAGVGMWDSCSTPEQASPVPSDKATPAAP